MATKAQSIMILTDVVELADIAAAKDIDTAAFIVQRVFKSLDVRIADFATLLPKETANKLVKLMTDAGL